MALSRKIGKREELVTELMIIAREELEHLQMVHDLIKSKGLGRERKDNYVNELFKFMKKMAAAMTLCASVYY
jgi:tRNA-(ms[2]io[6]A)-hydroxylase